MLKAVLDKVVRVLESEKNLPDKIAPPDKQGSVRVPGASDTLLTVSTDIRNVTRNTEEMTAWGAVAAFRVAELTEAAKTNFLFKRYFEERGYVEQAPFEIREQAIRASHREIEDERRKLYEWEQRLHALEARLRAAAPDTLVVPPGQ